MADLQESVWLDLANIFKNNEFLKSIGIKPREEHIQQFQPIQPQQHPNTPEINKPESGNTVMDGGDDFSEPEETATTRKPWKAKPTTQPSTSEQIPSSSSGTIELRPPLFDEESSISELKPEEEEKLTIEEQKTAKEVKAIDDRIKEILKYNIDASVIAGTNPYVDKYKIAAQIAKDNQTVDELNDLLRSYMEVKDQTEDTMDEKAQLLREIIQLKKSDINDRKYSVTQLQAAKWKRKNDKPATLATPAL